MKKMWVFWVLSIIITLAAAYYQRKTGPTYPKEFEVSINDQLHEFELLRSHEIDEPCEIRIVIPDQEVKGEIYYHRYPVDEPYSVDQFKRRGDTLVALLPIQPAAGKLQYYIKLSASGEEKEIAKGEPVIIRFKGAVPMYALIPHVIFMFMAMLMSTLAGLLAIFRHPKFRIYTFITFGLLLIGGMILGPVVQKFAFGEFWTGVPNGWDLTDNKTLIAFVFWIVAVIANIKKPRPRFVWVASLVLLMVYSIPHSMFGSEFDYSSGTVTQG